jgi:hypothetical protein
VALGVDLRADGIQVGQPARRFNPILTVTSLNERDQYAPGIWEGTDDIVMMSTCAGTHIAPSPHQQLRRPSSGRGRSQKTIGANNGDGVGPNNS